MEGGKEKGESRRGGRKKKGEEREHVMNIQNLL